MSHGTYAHYVTAKCRCDECREACNAYHREHRRKNPGRVALELRQNRAYHAAQVTLRERHRDEFEAIYAAELARHGVPRMRDGLRQAARRGAE